MDLIFELSRSGQTALSLPGENLSPDELAAFIPTEYLRKELPLPEVAEIDVVRHFTNLSRRNFGVDSGFYPLGSCTMKYNPKVNEEVAQLSGFANLNPFQDVKDLQGILEALYNFNEYLKTIFGYDAFTLQPAAGAHGELTALFMVKAYHLDRKDTRRRVILIPDSAHGTNPASVNMIGFETRGLKSNAKGGIDLDALKRAATDDVAGLMLTNPNTLGLFDENILSVAEIVHKAGGILYYDGANANAIMGICRPADLGFDVAHLNLHKTFATPHGGGGPGSGPVGVNKKLEPFLPVPRIVKTAKGYEFNNEFPKSIGRVHSFYGNVAVIMRALTYVRSLGGQGLREVSQDAVLSANYLKEKLKKYYYLPYDQTCQHEFVLSAKWQKEKYGIKALDIAKRLIDYGYHPPTIYFPLIVEEAMMIEPTETESKLTLDRFADAMIAIAKECETNPDLVKNAPKTTPVSRLNETKAAREPNLRWKG